MKILEIKNKQGTFLSKEGVFKNITLITKDDIYYLLNTIYVEDTNDFDQCSDENDIMNPANKIIYERIYEKLILFSTDKPRMQNAVNSVFSEFVSVYRNELEEDK